MSSEAKAFVKLIKGSPFKVNQVAELIRGMPVEKAITQLDFQNKKVAPIIKEAIKSAISNAENNHDLDVDELYVSEAYAGKAMTLKRFRARARGRGAKVLKRFSNLTVIVKERE